MKIAQVYPHCSIRFPGPELGDALAIVNYELGRRLARRHEVVGYPRWSPGEALEEQQEGVTWHRVPQRLDRALNTLKVLDGSVFTARRPFRLSRWYYAPYGTHVARETRARGAELIHVHSVSNLLPGLARANPGVPLVLHVHDHLLSDYDAELVQQRLACAALVLGCSGFVIRTLRASFPALADRFQTLYNGVDARFLALRAQPAGSSRILYVGRLCPEKGFHVLLQALRLIADEPSGSLDAIGPVELSPRQYVDPFGTDPLFDDLARYYAQPRAFARRVVDEARALGTERVRLHGPLPNSQVSACYEQAGIFVFPSLWHEPFGIPVIEAMAAGLPVIATRGGALPEVIIDGETGILVERGDAAGLAQALRLLLRDPQLRARMGAAGRERVQRLFTWDRAVNELERLYARVVADASLRRSVNSSRERPVTS